MTIDIEVEKIESTNTTFGGAPEVVEAEAKTEAKTSFAAKAQDYLRGVWEGARATLAIVAKVTLMLIGGGAVAVLTSLAVTALAASSAAGDVRVFRMAHAGLQIGLTAVALGYLVATLAQWRLSAFAALAAVYVMVMSFGTIASTPDLTVWRGLRYDTVRMQTANPESRTVMEWLKGAPKPGI